MKKVLALLLTVAMVGTLTACGGSSTEAPTEAPAETEAPAAEEAPAEEAAAEDTAAPAAAKDSYTFGYIAYDMTDIWNEYSAKAFEYAATQAAVPVETVVLDSKNSLEGIHHSDGIPDPAGCGRHLHLPYFYGAGRTACKNGQ